jgi:branched-chain amino acid transport system substrate-binding protein
MRPARELIDLGATLFIGPDTIDLVSELRPVMSDRTVILPSFNTASDVHFKPNSWFVMGADTVRVACELNAQLRAGGRTNPLVIFNPTGYNNTLAWNLTNRNGVAKYVLPTDHASTTSTVRPIVSTSSDAYVLAAFPISASSLVYALAAIGALDEPARWYLSPSLHTPFFLDSIPRGSLDGARGIAPGTAAGAAEFRERFFGRWHDLPLDDAYAFFDAGAVTALALQRAERQEGGIPPGTGLSKHIVAVTHPGGTAVEWNQLDRGLALLREGREVQYVGVSGPLEFDVAGLSPLSSTNWWTIRQHEFAGIEKTTDCQ